MRRREFITLLGGTTMGWPIMVGAQQSAIPLVGFLNSASAKGYERQLTAFLDGLADGGYVDGRNVKIEYRWAESHPEKLPEMVGDLVDRKVTVIAATSTPAALAAKAANTSIPIVFETGFDPIRLGLVTNLSRPGANITGVTQLNAQVTPKRVELLHELVPETTVIALMVNPANPTLAKAETTGAQSALRSLGINLEVLEARSEPDDLEGAFVKLKQLGAGGLVIGADPLFTSRSELLGALAARYAVPAVFENRSFIGAGGLASYGGSVIDSYRLAGVYVARILKGEKPAGLPVQQGTKLELFVNAKAAAALGVAIPQSILARADEVIE